MTDVTQHNYLVANQLVESLAGGGVRHVVLSPGSRNTPLLLAFGEHKLIASYVIVDERSAAFFALGLARASEQPVALVCTSGSAAAHYFPALVEADASGVPLIVVTADRPPELHHVGALQATDQLKLFGSHVRFFADLGSAVEDTSHVRSVVAVALTRARGALSGPVHLNVAFREPLWRPELTGSSAKNLDVLLGRSVLDSSALKQLAVRLQQKERGVIVCGPYAKAQTVMGLAQKLKWPIIAEASSQLRFGYDVINAYDALLRDAHFAQEMAPDCV